MATIRECHLRSHWELSLSLEVQRLALDNQHWWPRPEKNEPKPNKHPQKTKTPKPLTLIKTHTSRSGEDSRLPHLSYKKSLTNVSWTQQYWWSWPRVCLGAKLYEKQSYYSSIFHRFFFCKKSSLLGLRIGTLCFPNFLCICIELYETQKIP